MSGLYNPITRIQNCSPNAFAAIELGGIFGSNEEIVSNLLGAFNSNATNYLRSIDLETLLEALHYTLPI